ncbi:hypothetical protein DINM_000749 [Dirofilaria immitis]|nr:hypothetical protein [Dirofilaria immitis]
MYHHHLSSSLFNCVFGNFNINVNVIFAFLIFFQIKPFDDVDVGEPSFSTDISAIILLYHGQQLILILAIVIHLLRKKKDEIINEAERKRYEWGVEKFAYDLLASDKIGPHRKLSPVYHKLCESLSRNISLDVSIIIIYHNEALSVLIRMLNSIFDHTPSKLLNEIILYDDYSDYDTLLINHIINYGNHVRWPMEKIITWRSNERLGLIKAKVYASRMAHGDVLIFWIVIVKLLHYGLNLCYCQFRKILQGSRMRHENKVENFRVVLPVVDLISPKTFEFSKAMIAKGVFDWHLDFSWKYLPWEYWDLPENNIKPFR